MSWPMLQWLAKNLGTFFFALILAFIVWVLAVINADPNIICPAPTSVPLDILGRDPEHLLFGEIPDTIAIQLRAPRSVCEQLAARPGEVVAFIDLSTLRAGEHTVEVSVQWQPEHRPVRLLSKTPEVVTLTLEEFQTRALPLVFDILGEPAPGFTKGATIVSASRVTISGRKSLVEQVFQAVTSLDITDAIEDVEAERPVVLLDRNGNPISGLTVEPSTVNVRQLIGRPSTYRELTVKVVTVGQPAEGYRLTNITTFPQVVTVFSTSAQLIREMPGFVETTPITLTGATNDIEQRVFLVLPEGVSIAGEQSVLVQISIAAIESSQTFTLNVEAIGLSPGLAAEIAPATVDVIVSGPLPTLQTLQPTDIRVVVDLIDLGPGVYSLQPRVEILPPGLRAESTQPATIEVTLTAAPTGTPTPTATLTPLPPPLTPTP